MGAGAVMRRVKGEKGERVQGPVLPRVPVRHLRTYPRVARGESGTKEVSAWSLVLACGTPWWRESRENFLPLVGWTLEDGLSRIVSDVGIERGKILFLKKHKNKKPQGGDLFLFTHLLVEVSVLFIYLKTKKRVAREFQSTLVARG